MALLEVRGLTKIFGGLTAVGDLSFDVNEGEIVGIIGPNGAGKSTVFNMVCGTLKPTAGTIKFRGKNITGLAPHKIAKKGIARVFQGNVLFPASTVLDNVVMGAHLHTQLDLFGFLFGGRRARRKEEAVRARAMEILELVGLADDADTLASDLPHGNQRHLCLAVALAVEPKLLLLDEPVTGMNAEEVSEMLDLIRMLREKTGLTLIVIEHNMKAVMGLCDRIVVISYGVKIAEGLPQEIANNPAVIEAYLGVEDDAA
ncbi:MAG: ABC transporter ATP-binding protein [Actinomycetia bacterium]|nr:ABC transporter ATP-binding protein [Actinomycetes bacterium]